MKTCILCSGAVEVNQLRDIDDQRLYVAIHDEKINTNCAMCGRVQERKCCAVVLVEVQGKAKGGFLRRTVDQRCKRDAEFEIYGMPTHPDDVTETCGHHVGLLLGTPTWRQHDNTHWVIYPIITSRAE